MRALFIGKSLIGIVDGTQRKPPAAHVDLTTWLSKDSHAISFLCSALDESILDLVCGLGSSIEI